MSSEDRVAFVSGSNRGIGLGMTLEMAKSDFTVVAGHRIESKSQELFAKANESRNILPVKVDVTVEGDLKYLCEFIENRLGHLDILVNSAGVNINEFAQINDLAWEDFAESLKVNLGGPFLTSRYLFPLLVKGKDKKIINISSQMGSIQLSGGGATPYRVSKAALNMLTKNQAIEYKREGITVVCLHPGWVRTDMGGQAAPMTAAESARRILQIIEIVSLSNAGEFISFNGDAIPY